MAKPIEKREIPGVEIEDSFQPLPLKMSLMYLGLAACWVIAWDVIIWDWLGFTLRPWMHIANDWGAVLGTTAILYVMLKRYFTRLERSEEARRESQARYRVLANAAREGLVIHDRGKIVDVNAALERLVGYPHEELVGMDIFRLVAPESHPAVREAVASGSTRPYEAVGVRKSGETFLVELCGQPFFSRGREMRLVTVQDLTERVKLESQFRHAQKMEAVGRLAGGIAHDFNNLLTAILGYSGFVLDQIKPDDPIRKDVEEIRRAGERASSLTRQLLTFSRKQDAHPVVVDIHEALKDMEKLLRRLVGEDVQVIIESEPGVGRALVDHGQLEQVIMNLAVNARDAMPSGGTLTLSARPATQRDCDACIGKAETNGPFVGISVKDTGVGMTPDVKAHLFEPFFTTKAEGKGTGLGLATVYGIVKRHRGCLSVVSAPGQGSTFHVLLPSVPLEGASAMTEAGSVPSLRGSESVLFVEDDAEVRHVMVKSLRSYGYDVVEAENGQEGLDRFVHRTPQFDVLITDSVMPTMSGETLAAKLKAFHPGLAVVHISGHPEQERERPDASEDLTASLQKPFRPEVLVATVRRLGNRRRLRRQDS